MNRDQSDSKPNRFAGGSLTVLTLFMDTVSLANIAFRQVALVPRTVAFSGPAPLRRLPPAHVNMRLRAPEPRADRQRLIQRRSINV